jgi:hypothetical protein
MKKLTIPILFTVSILIQNIYFSQVTELQGLDGSEQFGYSVTVLSNGNFVITDPFFDNGEIQDVGAVYLYDGSTKTLISTLKGSNAFDKIGYDSIPNSFDNIEYDFYGIIPLTNGNFIVHSPLFDNENIKNVGAVTLVNGFTGLSANVNSSNSILGSTYNDQIGIKLGVGNEGRKSGITVLSNDKFLISSSYFDNQGIVDVGAVTYCDGITGLNGFINENNSLLGSFSGDHIGNNVLELTNGNFVLGSPDKDFDGVSDCGSVTWCNKSQVLSGFITISNSLYSNKSNSFVGENLNALTNGNYVVISQKWINTNSIQVGAATWCDGSVGRIGLITSSNSIVGQNQFDLRYTNCSPLTNGNYVLGSSFWKNGNIQRAGALTWCDGNIGRSGFINSTNSLVGIQEFQNLGKCVPLLDGNYLMISPFWDHNGAIDAGAVAWCDGNVGRFGDFDTTYCLLGSNNYDMVGNNTYINSAYLLTNGNYVINSPYWDNGLIQNVGAVTFVNKTNFPIGRVSSQNSLIGKFADDKLGEGISGSKGIFPLSNGNYVITCYNCDTEIGADYYTDAGAVIWVDGTIGNQGVISSAISITSNKNNNKTGNSGVLALNNGNYAVLSHWWSINDTDKFRIGAVTWANGSQPTSLILDETNSLIGSKSYDLVGQNFGMNNVEKLNNGDFLMVSIFKDYDNAIDAGAVTYCNGKGGTVGEINNCNSIIGTDQMINRYIQAKFNETYEYVIVGMPSSSKVICRDRTDLPSVSIAPINDICDTAEIIVFNQGSPIGGTYTINNQDITSFDPSTSSLGSINVVYTFTQNGCINSASTMFDVLDCSSGTGVGLNEIESNISLYPNPTNGKIELTGIDINELKVIEFYDYQGKLLETFNSNKIDISSFSNGIYYLKVLTNQSDTMNIIHLMK